MDRLAHRQGPDGLDPLPDGLSFDELEGDVMEGPILPDTENSRDVFVIEPGGRSPLLVEPRDNLGITSLIGRQELQRDLAVELGVQGAVDRTHAPHADRFFEQEPIEHIARHG